MDIKEFLLVNIANSAVDVRPVRNHLVHSFFNIRKVLVELGIVKIQHFFIDIETKVSFYLIYDYVVFRKFSIGPSALLNSMRPSVSWSKYKFSGL